MAELSIIFAPNQREVTIRLSESGSPVDELIIGVDIHFDTVLVTSIDKLFKKNRIDESSLKVITVLPETDIGSVAYRTAQAVAEALKS